MNFYYYAIVLRSGTRYITATNEGDAVILAQAEAINDAMSRTVLSSSKITYELYMREKYKR